MEYICLYMFIIVFSFFLKWKFPEEKNLILSIVGFTAILILVAFRHPSMGNDLGYYKAEGYLTSFDFISTLSWRQVLDINAFLNYEKGYILFNKLVGVLGNGNRQMLLVMSATVSILPVAYITNKKSKNIFMSLIIYLGVPTFLLLYSGLRQSIAIAICFLSIDFIQKKQLKKFVLTIAVATLFHYSSFVFLFAYVLYYIKIGKQFRWLSVIILPIIFIFRYPLFQVLSKIFQENARPDDNGSITLMLLFSLIYVFCICFQKKSETHNGYLNLFYIACVCQIFGNIFNTALRVGYYFVIVLVLLLPDICESMVLEQNKRIMNYLIPLGFILFGLYNILNNSWAMAYPYYWFWEII